MAPPSPDLSLFNSTSTLLSVLDLNDQQMQNLENMDIDLATVPDTPDRGGNIVEQIHSSSGAGSSGISNILDGGFQNRARDWGRLNTESKKNMRLFSHPRGDVGIHGETQQNSHSVVNLVDSPAVSKNAHVYKRMMSGKFSSRPRFTEHVAFSNDRAKLDGETSSIAELLADDGKKQGKHKEKVHDLVSSPKMTSKTSYTGGRNLSSAGVGVDCVRGTRLHSDTKENTEQIMSNSLQSPTSRRKNGQRRLVRNGCISPENIEKAKAKCTVESHEKCCEDGKQDDVKNMVSSFRGPPNHIHIVSPISGGNSTDRVKGKGIMEECSTQKYDCETLNSTMRSSLNPTEEANITEDVNRDSIETFEGRGGWRSTRSRSNNTPSTLSDGIWHLTSTNDGVGHSHEISDPISLQRGPTPFLDQVSSDIRSGVHRESGRHCGTSKIGSRQRKRGSASSGSGECSTSVSDDMDIAFLWSSEEPSNARSTRSRSNRHRGNLHTVIDIDDMSPELQNRGPQSTTPMVNDDSDAKERQLEADEMLARELQEQFYHELPGVGGGEVDANIAWTLQHEEEAQRASSLRRQHVHPRDASMSHLYRQHQTQALQNSLIRSTSRANRGRARAPRVSRLRDRVLGNPPTRSSRERNIHFHPNMDVEMRMHILEALEAYTTTEEMMPSSFLQLQRDFNENDYEMLLALDEDNHQHVGANPALINELPQSTVRTENFAETCAVCLETPTIGDTIRHLPCLHKFHKDCIDPWLRRKTSCPICKSGIT